MDKLLKNNNIGAIAVFYGGVSSEREVSLCTGKAVYTALKKKDIEAKLFDIPSDLNNFLENRGSYKSVFIALHGDCGENGSVQGLLKVLNIPFTGSGVLGCALAMDKVQSKNIWQKMGLPIIDGIVLPNNINFKDAKLKIESFGFPCFLKPVAEGSSMDVYCLKSIADLEKLSDKLSAYFFKKNWMLERRISGREFSVGILNNQALPIVEIKPKDEYYSYDAKYFSDQTEYICPANLSEEDTQKMQLLAQRAFKAINCEHWGRVDFMMDDFGVYLLEVNTVPGLTPSSLVPKAASSVGIEFDDLILKLLELERVTC